MNERPPVERSTRYATTVNSLDEAFALAMGRLSEDGADTFHGLEIKPIWQWDHDERAEDSVKRFTVVYESFNELPAYQPEQIP